MGFYKNAGKPKNPARVEIKARERELGGEQRTNQSNRFVLIPSKCFACFPWRAPKMISIRRNCNHLINI